MGTEILDELFAVIEERRDNPRSGSYTSRILKSDRVLDKVDEEAAEFIKAVKNEKDEAIVHEAADLLYHVMVALAAKGIKFEAVMDELKRRRR